MTTALVTGATQGLGLEHARQFLERGWRVLATCRKDTRRDDLGRLAAQFGSVLRIREMDVTSDPDVEACAVAWSREAIDVLLNNAGTFGPSGAPEGMAYQGLEHMDYAIWRQILEVNLLGAFRVAVAFRRHLQAGQGRRLVMMSSDLGSIAANHQGSSYAYRSSKAGLNMITRGMAAEWPDLIVTAMAPGWTRTALGGPDAPLAVEESVRMQQGVIDRLTAADSGRFINRFGDDVPW